MKKIPIHSLLAVMVIIMLACSIVTEDIETPRPPTRVPPTNLPVSGAIDSQIWQDGMQGLYVPEGEFKMGPEDGDSTILPDTIYLDAFWIDQTEVTNAMYEKCVEAGVCSPPSADDSYTRDSYFGDSQYADYPVIYVNWYQAQEYCNWAGRRLPTEAEWEKAARGTDARKYPWGEQPPTCDLAHYTPCLNDSAIVSSHLAGASPYGALDMAGNVWEWVSSLKWGYAYDANDGREDPDASGSRVKRGGSWSYLGVGNDFYTTIRSGSFPESSYHNLGFRCAR